MSIKFVSRHDDGYIDCFYGYHVHGDFSGRWLDCPNCTRALTMVGRDPLTLDQGDAISLKKRGGEE